MHVDEPVRLCLPFFLHFVVRLDELVYLCLPLFVLKVFAPPFMHLVVLVRLFSLLICPQGCARDCIDIVFQLCQRDVLLREARTLLALVQCIPWEAQGIPRLEQELQRS